MRSFASSTYWKQRTGRLPEELIFDSKLTTYANLNELNQMGIRFITLRRRSKKLARRNRPSPEYRPGGGLSSRAFPGLQDATRSGSPDHAERLRRTPPPTEHHRLGT